MPLQFRDLGLYDDRPRGQGICVARVPVAWARWDVRICSQTGKDYTFQGATIDTAACISILKVRCPPTLAGERSGSLIWRRLDDEIGIHHKEFLGWCHPSPAIGPRFDCPVAILDCEFGEGSGTFELVCGLLLKESTERSSISPYELLIGISGLLHLPRPLVRTGAPNHSRPLSVPFTEFCIVDNGTGDYAVTVG